MDTEVEQRDSLLDDIARVRRRVVDARAGLASGRDPVVRAVLSAQRILTQEQLATDAEIARTLGHESRPQVENRGTAVAADRRHFSSADLPWLYRELDRLGAQAEVLEGQGQLVAAAAAAGGVPAGVGPLAALLGHAVEATRGEQRRARERALQDAGDRLARARTQPGTNAAPERRSIERAPRDAGGPSDEGARGPTPASPDGLLSNPLVLDILLPLVAVAIVLLVVLSWMG